MSLSWIVFLIIFCLFYAGLAIVELSHKVWRKIVKKYGVIDISNKGKHGWVDKMVYFKEGSEIKGSFARINSMWVRETEGSIECRPNFIHFWLKPLVIRKSDLVETGYRRLWFRKRKVYYLPELDVTIAI